MEQHIEEGSGVESGDNALDSDNDSEDSEPSVPELKRARKSKATDQAPRKKYVRGKQGGLEGIMKMPIEVFTEITYYLTPADLLALTRANKFFRSMLLRRQAIQLWQRAQNNVPELPPCPTGMNEPQYAALMFSKHCTLCGASATSRPDPWLRVRLCGLCRGTKLEHAPRYPAEDIYVATSRDIKSLRPHETALYIIEEYEQSKKSRADFRKEGDLEGLADWTNARTIQLKAQREEGLELKKFIRSADRSRGRELTDLKATRQREVEEKLRALGWEDQYLRFWDSPDSRAWNSLVRVPKALTERVWANLLPKLTPLLETNRNRIDERARLRRRQERREKVLELLYQLTHDMYPYRAIMETLGLKLPGPRVAVSDGTRFLSNPTPSVYVMIDWDILAKIVLEENSLERVEELFDQRRPEITKRVLEWREELENKLVEGYKVDVDETEDINFVVKIKGSVEAADGLSLNAKVLLRADTVFLGRAESRSHTSPEDKEHGPMLPGLHFPGMISRNHYSASSFSLGNLIRHTGVEKIVKALLKNMHIPDAAYMEVNMRESAYACQRCRNLPFARWEDLISHYHQRLRQWVDGKFVHHRYTTRHPVVFLPTHNLEPKLDARPLALMLPGHETRAAGQTNVCKDGYLWCLICCGVLSTVFGECSSLDVLKEHMHDNHGITGELVEGLHYTGHRITATGHSACVSQWQQKWDDFYDAQA